MEVKRQLELLGHNLEGIPEESSFGRYIGWLNQQLGQKSKLFEQTYEPIVRAEEPYRGGKKSPFLTVITRTQGKRPEMLRETLLSLNGQTDGDFELLLIGHKLDAQQAEVVKQIIWEQPDNFAEKIRFIRLDSGNRTAPLNLGFAHARGNYISVLDDDDIVLDNWVEEFHRAALKYSGRILHAYVFTQEWMTISAESGLQALRAVKAPGTIYCEKYDFLQQMRVNKCPLIGLSFPAFYFQKLGLTFDEQLTTTEDWDYLERVSFLAGVKDIEVATSIYRLWVNAENSSTVHSQQEWQKNYALITEKIMDMPILIPQGSRKSVSQETMVAIQGNSWPYRSPRISWCLLFLNRGEGFNENDMVGCTAVSNGISFDVEFHLDEAQSNGISEVRFDACEEGMFVMQNVLALVQYWDGSSETRTIEDCYCNGAKTKNAICFIDTDPQVIWRVNRWKSLKCVRIIGEVNANLTLQSVQSACQVIGDAQFQLFYKTKEIGFCQMQSYSQRIQNGFFQLTFPVNSEETITALRLDPGDDAGLLWNLRVELVDLAGNITSISPKDGRTNGTWRGDYIVFKCSDPQIIWPIRAQKLRQVKISGVYDSSLQKEKAVQQQTRSKLLSRFLRWFRKAVNKCFGR